MTETADTLRKTERIWRQFGEWPLDNIRKWSREPFEGGTEYVLASPQHSEPIPSKEREWPMPGDVMRYLDEGGYEMDRTSARLYFTKGQVATVRDFRLGGWNSTIAFECIPGHFNSVMFERALDAGKEG